MGVDDGVGEKEVSMTLTEAEEIAADRIARAIEKGTGYNMESAARMARAAIGYIQNVGLEIRFVPKNPDSPANEDKG
jgi:hypothetical protein